MSRAHLLTVYERAGCHLCEDMLTTLSEWRAEFDFDVQRVDVDTSPELAARYGPKVPILMHGPDEVCHFFLDLDALRRSLGAE